VAINLIGMGGAKYLAARTFTGTEGGGASQSPPLPSLPTLSLPGASAGLGSIESRQWFGVSDLAGILAGLLTNLSVLTVLAVGLFAASWWVLWRTTFGLRLRSCGEAPAAAETLGVNVYLHKWIAVLISGGLAGLGGAYLSLVADNIFRDGQTGGRGYIGLAAMIFGNWRPGGLLAGSGLVRVHGRASGSAAAVTALHALLLAIADGPGARLRPVAGASARSAAWPAASPGGVAVVVGLLVAWWLFAVDQVPGELREGRAALRGDTLLVLAFASAAAADARGGRHRCTARARATR
jgi:hypothetical protein